MRGRTERGDPAAWPDWPDGVRDRHREPAADDPGRAAPTVAHRAFETVPWSVLPVYASRYPLRMLRLLGRRRAGLPLSPTPSAAAGGPPGRTDGLGLAVEQRLAWEQRLDAELDAWLELVRRERVVVAYCPMTDEGLHYLDESMRSGPNDDVPVRVQVVRWIEEMPVREIDDGRPAEPPRVRR